MNVSSGPRRGRSSVTAGCWLGWVAAALLGCGGRPPANLPKTYEVRGIVLGADNEPAQGGSIEFTPKQLGGQKFLGIIGLDGKFTARTIAAEGAAGGAPEGTYTAVVVPAMS